MHLPSSLPPCHALQGLSRQSHPLATGLQRMQSSLGGIWPRCDAAAALKGCVTWARHLASLSLAFLTCKRWMVFTSGRQWKLIFSGALAALSDVTSAPSHGPGTWQVLRKRLLREKGGSRTRTV